MSSLLDARGRIRQVYLTVISMTSKDALVICTDVQPPVFFKGEYEQWKDRFLDFIDHHENGEYIKQSLDEGVMKRISVEVPDIDSSESEDGDEPKEPKTKKIVLDISTILLNRKRDIKLIS
ncbi:hypothetical protein L6452_06263 [Arctium lappa]|uniref:Uncharacterized protein n=1 Tax=Arctium lappa TaxID=4217 RepID=A0ACB9EIM2_ARCLA|nr:hypothetical protein L6452_06263 [Arctium lappa]